MYDFWYTLGAAVVDPELLDAIEKAGPVFTFVPRRVIEFAGGKQLNVRSGPSTGLLERDSTTKVRAAIARFLKERRFPEPPPIGIYTAGRFCQLIKIPRFQSTAPKSTLRDVVASAHQAYLNAARAHHAAPLATLDAALGLCLMDSLFATGVVQWPNPVNVPLYDLEEILSEFHIVMGTPHGNLLAAFVGDQGFADAVNFLMAGNSNPWDETGNTIEQAFFWPSDGTLKGEHAVP